MSELLTSLWILDGDGSKRMELRLRAPACTLGREDDNDLVVDDDAVSSNHARFFVDEKGQWWIEDLGSTNGTWIEGEELTEPFALSEGVEIEIGTVKVVVKREIGGQRSEVGDHGEEEGDQRSEVEGEVPKFLGRCVSYFFLSCSMVHAFLAKWIPWFLGKGLRMQGRVPRPIRFAAGFGVLALTAALMGWLRLPGHFVRMGYSEEALDILRQGGFGLRLDRLILLSKMVTVLAVFTAGAAFLRRKMTLWIFKALLAFYLLWWLMLFGFYIDAPAWVNELDYKLFSSDLRNEYWIRSWFSWGFALIMPGLLGLGVAMRNTRAHYVRQPVVSELIGDRVVENLRAGGPDPRMRSSAYWALFLFFITLVMPFLMGRCGWEKDYGLVKGSGNPVVEMVRVKRKKEKPKKRMIVNNWSPYIFERMKIDDIKVLEEMDEESLDTYEITQQQTGKLGKGGGETGGWPQGMEGATVRFIRLKYSGGDWDQDMGRGADYNLLLRFNQITGFPIAKETEARDVNRLRFFAKGKQPPFVYLTGKGDIRMSSTDISTLRWYSLEQGGMLFIDNGGPGRFDRNVRNLLGQIFPGQRLVDIPNDDPIYQAPFVFPSGAPPLWKHAGTRAQGIRHNGRWVVFYHPGDMADAWRDGHSGAAPEIAEQAYRLGINVMYYSFNNYYALHYE
jgi:hypothetical protein